MKLWQIDGASNNSLNEMISDFAGHPIPSDYHACWLKCCAFASLALAHKFKVFGRVVPEGVVAPGLGKIEVLTVELKGKTRDGAVVWDLANLPPESIVAGFYITNWKANAAIEGFLNLRSNLNDVIRIEKNERYASASPVLDFPLDAVNFSD